MILNADPCEGTNDEPSPDDKLPETSLAVKSDIAATKKSADMMNNCIILFNIYTL